MIKNLHTTNGFARRADKIRRTAGHWQRLLPLGMAFSLPQLLRGEDHADYRYEYYNEDNNRMSIETHSVYFEQKLADAVTAKGEFVYDSISGATPIGTHDLTGKVLTTDVKDTRYAGNIGLDCRLLNHVISPGFAYSQESDYISYGISLGDAIEFNDKNTILQFGASHNFDDVRQSDRTTWSGKDSTDIIIGVSQLLSPVTVVNAAFTFGYDDGFLNDPYRLAEYHPTIFPTGFDIGVPEHRPGYRSKEVLFTSVTHYFDNLNASLEASYRFHHDSYDVFSHTLGLTWHQHLGKHFIVEPMFRFYGQTAASFYTTTFSGPFTADPAGLHSSDYRLSEFYSTDCGIQATAIINDHVQLVAGYHRYEMRGLDNTSADMYPKANVYTVGLSIIW
ncbi:MAG TPA: DUF3570 domain-containing protein [Verrucomicrobiae bacterium]|nr:DUF3570 domain-containing protein [Verrucomicrobiae bacterium]